jgi:hypothetical protein
MRNTQKKRLRKRRRKAARRAIGQMLEVNGHHASESRPRRA